MEIINFLSSHADLKLDASFKDITTIKMGGKIKYLISPFDMNRLKLIINFLKEYAIPYKVVGRGSNMVCGSSDYNGCVILLEHINHYHFEDDNTIYVESGMVIPRLANTLAKLGYSGLEFASGIPGNLGGLVFMNAGAYKKEMSDIISEVLVLSDGEYKWLNREECAFSYRHSIFHERRDIVILAARLNLVKRPCDDIRNLIQDRLARRRATQPLDKPSCGSCFKNPEGDYAWRLIDGVGMRGYNYHGIEVSQKHPNFIINAGGGTGEAFVATLNLVKTRVLEEYGVSLREEVEIFNC